MLVVGKDERPIRIAGKVFVKEVYARGSKEDLPRRARRAPPTSAAACLTCTGWT